MLYGVEGEGERTGRGVLGRQDRKKVVPLQFSYAETSLCVVPDIESLDTTVA